MMWWDGLTEKMRKSYGQIAGVEAEKLYVVSQMVHMMTPLFHLRHHSTERRAVLNSPSAAPIEHQVAALGRTMNSVTWPLSRRETR